jgi:integrase
MAQQGSISLVKNIWYLRYRHDVLVDGVIVRKQKNVPLAKYHPERYRRESDLTDLAAAKMADVRQAAKCPESANLFVDFVEMEYLPYVQRSKKPSTYNGYRDYWRRYLKPRVKPYATRDFTIAITSKLLEDIAKAHDVNVETVGKVRSILSAIFTFALAKGAYPGKSEADNPCRGALLPEAQPKQETVAAQFEDVKAILAHLEAEKLMLVRAAVAIIAYTGVRPGEARGLRWEDWNRDLEQIHVQRSVWQTHETKPKTAKSIRFVAVASELRSILLALWESQARPDKGYILQRAPSPRNKRPKGRVNLDNMSKREIVPALSRCAVCKQRESADHEGHAFERDETLPTWNGWYSLRRLHGTEVRKVSSSDTTSKALGNSPKVFEDHYNKQRAVLPDVRTAVNSAMTGLVN